MGYLPLFLLNKTDQRLKLLGLTGKKQVKCFITFPLPIIKTTGGAGCPFRFPTAP